MRLPLLLASLVLCGVSQQALAQAPEAKPLAVVQRTTIYFDANGGILPSEAGAHHREEITFRDSVSGTVRIFFPSGKIRRIIPYAHIQQGIQHGVETNWLETGQMQAREEYVAGKLHGERLVYYPSGTLKRRETYVKGFRTAGELFGPDGQPRTFAEAQAAPVYPGGQPALAKDLYGKMRYPVSALRNRKEGTVLVAFTVAKSGVVQNAHVLKSDSELLNETAVASVMKLKPFQPGMEDGEPVETEFTFPIVFKISYYSRNPDALEALSQSLQGPYQQIIMRPAPSSPNFGPGPARR
ncbi:TonB family protein [Hymenobacter sp. BT635]|uniref:TonB family protein n=1 Tax=Hymenobacter nitidus TaxID=2880929 RepID=A0ABS8A9M6_9BACT|nr:energy transducer TonB [Hymenobacter nitidus]MCB2377098.1 TonB family protein [Hymenobacter nitidus]